MFLLRRSISFLAALILVCLGASLAAASGTPWHRGEQARYAAEQRALEQREQQALNARAKAESVTTHARQINDQQAILIAERAAVTADKALQRIRKAMERNGARLASVKRLSAVSDGSIRAVASSLRGIVEIKTPQGWKALAPDRVLGPGEVMRTGADGYAEVMFNDGSRINLHANTSFQLQSEYADGSDYQLSRGRIKAQVERLGQRRYSFRTPTAVAGVRGTDFILEAAPDGESSLVVLKGEVAFGHPDREQRLTVRQGEKATLASDGALRGAQPVDLKALSPWWE